MQSFFEAISANPRVGVTGITASQADCEAVAALFDSTCPGTTKDDAISDMSAHAGEDLNCEGQMMCPDGSGSSLYTNANPCTFTRKLCVTCKTKMDGSVVMRF